MAQKNTAGGWQELVPLAEVVPLVGSLLGAAARLALKENELQAVRGCLVRAFEIDDASAGVPGRLARARHFRARRAWRAARRQAAEDVMAAGGILAAPRPGKAREDAAPVRDKSAVTLVDAGGSREAVLANIGRLAHGELEDALAAEAFTPWTLRLAAALALNIQGVWDTLLAAPSATEKEQREKDEKLQRLARIVLNREAAKVGDVDDDAFDAFGQRVGPRFTANLAAHEALHYLVARLDREDAQRAEVAMVTATQGLRVAVLSVAIAAAIAAAALVEMAIERSI